MKKQGYVLQFTLIIVFLLTLFSEASVYESNSPYSIDPPLPMISPQKVELNGVQSPIGSYLIDGQNYYKLRDLAKILMGTDGEFSVKYLDKEKAVVIDNDAKYIMCY